MTYLVLATRQIFLLQNNPQKSRSIVMNNREGKFIVRQNCTRCPNRPVDVVTYVRDHLSLGATFGSLKREYNANEHDLRDHLP